MSTIEKKIRKFIDYASKSGMSEKYQMKYKKIFASLVRHFNKFDTLPNSFTQERIIRLFRDNPAQAQSILELVKPSIKRELVMRAQTGDDSLKARELWNDHFLDVIDKLKNPDSNKWFVAEIEKEKVGRGQELKLLAATIENVNKDIKNDTNIVGNLNRIEAILKNIGTYYEQQKDKGGSAFERVEQMRALLRNSGIPQIKFADACLSDNFIHSLDRGIDVINQGLSKVPNLEFETDLLHKHHSNPIGLFKMLRGKETTAVELLSALKETLVGLREDLEKLKTIKIVDDAVGDVYKQFHGKIEESNLADDVGTTHRLEK